MHRNLWIALVALVALLVVAAGCASQPAAPAGGQAAKPAAAPDKVYTMSISSSLNPGEPIIDVLPAFKKEVEEKSKGRIKIEIYPSAQLGTTEQTIELVKSGAHQAMVSSPQFLAKYAPEMQVLTLPYLFDNFDTVNKALDGPVGKEMADVLEKKSAFKVLGYEAFGFKNVVNKKRAVNSVEDLKGLKLRVIDSPITLKTFESLGASPVGMAWAEVYTAIQTGVIDGAEVPYTVIRSSKIHEVAKYISATGHFYEIAMMYGNKDFFNNLPADLKDMVLTAFKEMAVKERKVNYDTQDKARADMVAQGAVVNNVAPAEIAKMQAAVKPVYDWAKQQWGEEAVSKVLKAAGR